MAYGTCLKGLAVIILGLTLGACAKPTPLYVYGDYSESYYKDKKTANEESRLKLEAAMEKAIGEAANSRSGRVPPGMYANLGYMYLQDGKAQEAISLFEKEKAVYPEAAHFMDRIIAKVEKAEGANK